MGVRVMIVEDEQIVAADLEAKLIQMGHDVIGMAASGEEALQLVEQHRPDLVLLDIQLQGSMTGIEAGQRIRESSGSQIIFVTAYAGVFLRHPRAMQPPGICLSKPFSAYQLQAALSACFAVKPV